MFPRRVQPIWYLEFAGAKSLAKLGFLETSARSVVSGVIPLAALEALDTKQSVSWAYVGGAVIALLVTLNLGYLEQRLQRRWVTTMGLGFLFASAAIFSLSNGSLIVLGIGLLASAASVFSVTMSLFIMESVSKQDLTRSESTRFIYAGAAWTLGPAGGVWLYQSVSTTAPFLVSAFMAVAALGYFWALRLGSNPALSTPITTATNPLRTVPRFFRQRYLRIAYMIIMVRAMFWVSIFVYGSLYIVDTDLPEWASGVYLSSMATLLFFSGFVAKLANRFGTRAMVIYSFGLIAGGMTFVASLGSPRPLGLAGWTIAAIGASAIDVVGNIPFMKTVKRRDRVPMTTVFSSWRDLSALTAPTMAGVVLLLAPFWLFYLALAAASLATAIAATYLPRRI